MSGELVLVTGGSGFIGVHCIDRLLHAGYRVRTSVRAAEREADVRAMLTHAGTPHQEKLTFVVADLARDDGWSDAVAGCRYVQHVASPFPRARPKHEDALIVPAREGTLRVLRAARDAGVERVVVTSSFAAVGYGHAPQAAPFDETSWTDVDGPGVSTYAKSKTLAERAAWDFIAREGGALELAVVNPTGVFGPTFGPDFSTSIYIVQQIMNGAVPFVPRITFGIVDVRDVADLHLRAMTNPAAKGERFLAVAGPSISVLDLAAILRRAMGTAARRAPTREAPDWLVRAFALVVPDLREVASELGTVRNVSSDKARRLLGWAPRTNAEAVVAAGESLARLGVVRR